MTSHGDAPAERALTLRVGIAVALGAVVAWVLLIVGAITTDALARERASDFAAERVRSILSLGPAHPVSVDIGGGLLIPQLWAQRLDRVVVTAADVSVGELTGDLRLTADGVPFDTTRPFDRVHAEVRVGEDVVGEVAERVTNVELTSVALVEPLLKFGTSVTFPAVSIMGVTVIPEFDFDVGIGVEPFVSEGRVGFTPVSFAFDGNELSAESFADTYRNAAQSLMQLGAICIADHLPAALKLEGVEVDGDELVIELGAAIAVFSTESLATRGECS